MNNDQFNQYDAEQFHQRVAEDLGITHEELRTWMINDIERVTEGGKEVGIWWCFGSPLRLMCSTG